MLVSFLLGAMRKKSDPAELVIVMTRQQKNKKNSLSSLIKMFSEPGRIKTRSHSEAYSLSADALQVQKSQIQQEQEQDIQGCHC